MSRRMGRHTYGKSADGASQLHQLDGVSQLALDRPRICGRVTTERHQVLHTRFAELHQDLGQLQTGVGHADEMRHRRQGGGAQHPDDQVVGALA